MTVTVEGAGEGGREGDGEGRESESEGRHLEELSEAIERLAQRAGLHVKVEDRVLRVGLAVIGAAARLVEVGVRPKV